MTAGGDVFGDSSACGYTLDPEDPDTWPLGVRVDPETVDDSDLPTCQREPLDDHERCGLHLPFEDRPANFDAAEKVADQLDAVTDVGEMTAGPAGTASLVGIQLDTLDFEDVIKHLATGFDASQLTTIDLRFTRVDGTLSFPSTSITQRLRLDGAAIGRFAASKTTFEREVSLARSLIGDPDGSEQGSEEELVLDLSNATVRDTLSLQDARIAGDASLSEVTPLARLLAMNATVDGLLALDGTTVQDRTRLTGVRCEQLSAIQADLHRAALDDITVRRTARLENIDVWGDADDDPVKFGTATFGGRVLLNDATFHTAATLQSITVDGQLELENAAFRESTDLHDAEFHGAVEATGAEFDATLDGSAARFEERATFDGATFGGTTRFEEAVFGNHAHFDRATFHDTAVFDDVEFKADCFFRATAADQAPATGRAASDTGPTAAAESVTDTDSSPAKEREPVSDGGQSGSVGIFQESASFERTIVNGQADFRVLETGPAATDPFSPEAEIARNATTVAEAFSAPEATLSDAELAGFTVGDGIDIRGADLAGANLRRADLRGALAERATFSHANCFATEFQDARLHGAVFEGTRIDDRTDFGDRVIYHTEAKETTDRATELARLEEAISLYSQLETLTRDNGQPAVTRTMFVNRKDAQRRKMRLVERTHTILGREFPAGSGIATALDRLDHAFATLKWLVMNYGESYRRVVGTSVVIILLLGLVFPLLNLQHTTAGQLRYQGSLGDVVQAVVFGVLYSLSAFTTLGLGQFEPGPVAEALAVGEAGVGILMFGLLLFVLQRRTAR